MEATYTDAGTRIYGENICLLWWHRQTLLQSIFVGEKKLSGDTELLNIAGPLFAKTPLNDAFIATFRDARYNEPLRTSS